MGHIQSLADVLSMLRRYAWLLLVIMAVGLAVTLLAAGQMARSYESYSSLRVELPTVTNELASAQSTAHSAQRLQLMEHQLTSRDNLLRMADKYGVFTDGALSQAERAVAMRKSIRFETIRPQQQGGESQVSAMVIIVQMPKAQMAADVANDLAAQVLEVSARRQSSVLRETLQFYDAEDDRLRREIGAVEAEITAYKNQNVQALPENLASLRDQVTQLEAELRETDNQLMTLEQERRTIEGRSGFPRAVEQRQLAQIAQRVEMYTAQRDITAQAHAAFVKALADMPAVEVQLGTMARRLQQLQDQYSVITRRRAEAETGTRLDSDRQTERFEILESALPPDYPMASGRKKVLALGVGVSGILALGLIVLLEMRNPVLRSARQFERATGLRPVISLPILSARKRRFFAWGRGETES